jgi:orotidine-5'-phosphate decarboxylase
VPRGELKTLTPQERLIVALDLPTPSAAEAMIERLAGRVGMFKVGSQLFTLAGPEFVRRLVARGERVFLDLKYHDIPNTVASAVTAARELGVSLIDVHSLAGRAALEGAARALAGSATRLLAITVLTSHDEGTLTELGLAGPIPDAVRRLASLARQAGAHGVVASPHEVGLIRAACGPDFLVVTPGIRPAGTQAGDQARLATPGAAVAAGASYVVVGRPIGAAADPAAAADAIIAELTAARAWRVD